ncbi:HAD family hydrolase [Rhizobium mesosinicum]|uniref:HAD-IIB family hydrolase n=1 Tax=Rhizobium mesosinicum TaxID=335017 RepID=A0ABS7GZF9_9HYPH|nr:HAD-IIB family hydrolase [Rhizobium mesosinicum]MBW9054504.1 HAD-IIB family hydrolase [Rhizobium mesosinicum]
MTFVDRAPSPEELRGVRYLFTDIDDTLTTEGRLLPETYQVLWDLNDAGIAVIPVTGGSAGWCEHIVRAWPVKAVIGESGAYAVFQRGRNVIFDYWEGEAVQSERQRRHLKTVANIIAREGLPFQIAHDQIFRLADVAIDIVGRPPAEVDRLAACLRALGATVAISSIHINTWIGNYDKRAMSERLLIQEFGIGVEAVPQLAAFVGDSRNDAPMFGYIANSFGVNNILSILPQLPHAPRWISSRPAGLGFADIGTTILAAAKKHKGLE